MCIWDCSYLYYLTDVERALFKGHTHKGLALKTPTILSPAHFVVLASDALWKFFLTKAYINLPLWLRQVLVSPVLAGLAVGIGVPILLFYVYGVVPVSLCRSGGCGVSTSGTGVRFEFDDENELMGALGIRIGGGKYQAFVPCTRILPRLNQSYPCVCCGYSYSYRLLRSKAHYKTVTL